MSGYLVGRLNLTKFPPVLDRIEIMSSPAASMSSVGKERWVDLLPHVDSYRRLSYEEATDRICMILIDLGDSYFRWMEPLLNPKIAERCIQLQGIEAEGIGYELHKLLYNG